MFDYIQPYLDYFTANPEWALVIIFLIALGEALLIIGLFDLLTMGKVALSDPPWQSFSTEVYVFLGVIYIAFCYAMSRYARFVEARLAAGERR